MSEVIATSQWIQFFSKAGLPPNVAANYALIFSDNRIQLDMLMDLSKEYLYDMGIKIMGDVIAILRFSKEFHTQLAKDKIMGTMTTQTPKKAVERMLGHYARPMIANSAKLSSSVKEDMPVERMLGHYARPMIANSAKLSSSVKQDMRIPKKNIICLKGVTSEQPYPKKIRKVPPEEEGAYKIKMPSGSTERTRKILQQQRRLQQVSKRSVFDRLGESAVSSSTDSNKPSLSSVFGRLGPSHKGLHDDVPTSTSIVNEGDGIKKKGPPLPYKGVLKMSVGAKRIISTGVSNNAQALRRTVINPVRSRSLGNITKTISVNRINNILTTNPSRKLLLQKKNIDSQAILGDRVKVLNTLSVKSRLGNKVDARNFARTKMLQKAKTKVTVEKTTVFDRLGN